MGKRQYKKLEAVEIQSLCVVEGCHNQQALKGTGKYRPVCRRHHDKTAKAKPNARARPYAHLKRETCELCGFVPVNKCQLDVDHIDGNRLNNALTNLQTLCANCHRLKTWLNKDWE